MIEHRGPISGVATRQGLVATAGYDNQLILWDSRTGTSQRRCFHDHLVNMCVFGEGGELFTASSDHTARRWRVSDLRLLTVYADHDDVVRWLVARGADVDLRHDFGGAEHGRQATALHLAAQFGCLASIDALLAAGADRTIRDGAFDATPEHWAMHAEQGADVLDRLRS